MHVLWPTLRNRLISDQNVKTKLRKQIPRFEDKDFLGDWNSHTLHVCIRNPYSGAPVIRILPFPILPIGTNVSLSTRMCDPRPFAERSTDAVTGLRLLHLPSTRQIPTSGQRRDELSARQRIQCIANK